VPLRPGGVLADADDFDPIGLEPFCRIDDQPGVPPAPWRALAHEEEPDLAESANFPAPTLSFARSAR
jgi:hypothetical protein